MVRGGEEPFKVDKATHDLPVEEKVKRFGEMASAAASTKKAKADREAKEEKAAAQKKDKA
jgi:hypothetical protein